MCGELQPFTYKDSFITEVYISIHTHAIILFFMISGQLSPREVQTTLKSHPLKPHTFTSREALSPIKAFFSAEMGVSKCVILQLHKNLPRGTGFQPNQNMWSHTHTIFIQVRLLGFEAMERESVCVSLQRETVL